ncbi:glycosyltransferase family 4 protein [Segatella copri]|jgi:glycosyltransferase involved in cell wall biosynthesis|uniref:Glycosyltransferase family 4 protein n=1 Tax=Segatella copri TaxID=165179 RepID=A0AAW5UQ43_9BACT|nr:glycosyltransferase family 4 protein [Segatella copri]MCW4110652.1 glycosyltransferase family 4 protein [Segatella copri]MCW4120859.1 glycosyltransferase family 4 protein [Segatella copri]MCW4154630.1 glycosyltransferase family 4 protein [Segatella copri]
MISSEKILTIGPEYISPKGGVAQCLATYGKTVFADFRSITNSCSGLAFKKLIKMVTSLVKLLVVLSINRNIKIVHVHSASYNSFRRSSLYIKLAKMMGRKVIVHIHGGGFKEYYAKNKTFIDQVLRKCDAVIALSGFWKEFFVNTVGLDNVYIVPNIIENPVKLPIKKDGLFHLLFMGQILKAKGIFDLVEVINNNRDEYEGKLVLDIGGGMCEEDVLRDILQKEKLQKLVHFHGWVSGQKKIQLLNLANAFILPSYTEGVPISILEAESYGLPILATVVGGIPEIVENDNNGILFQPGDKVAIKESIDKILHNHQLSNDMGINSQKRSYVHLPIYVENELSKIYNSLI